MKKALICIGTILLIVLIVLILLFCLRSCSKEDIYTGSTSTSPSGIELDPNATAGGLAHRTQEEIQAELNEKVKQGMVNISMNTNPIFQTGTSEGNLLIVNSNRNNYPQVVNIVLKDTEESIYTSGAIPVGSKIENAKLSMDLDPGTYECIAYFSNVDINTGEYLGTAGAEIRITVNG